MPFLLKSFIGQTLDTKMRRFIITSKDFEGEVHALYADDSSLLMLDFRPAQLTDNQRKYIQLRTPSSLVTASINTAYGEAPITIINEAYEITFDDFWSRYQKKINKKRVLKYWEGMTRGDRAKAYAGLNPYKRHLKKNTWKTKADPETYLKNQMWENEWTD